MAAGAQKIEGEEIDGKVAKDFYQLLTQSVA